ncbi:formate dehydrogenase subunit delta [Sphingosinicella rhizophila]|uniref:Formate dehydrogenase subunit delta n=1 Tax=Sphingosinicella rhizophila TaxID=3050082 RepID=A0ABU3Q6R9_9SPHN|nr:formate dehydrogenase subunit delta [Sphingosinicella sp. GR2756]MDT9598789.1 formate dehydrogenase subunit delta [Sphingosinicella sp. GR2756]
MSAATLEKLVYMVNQIGRELDSQHPGDAAQATYDHLWHFWDPWMRSQILDHLAAGGSGLNEVARAALTKLQLSASKPRTATKATEFNKAHDHERDRDLMSDAG